MSQLDSKMGTSQSQSGCDGENGNSWRCCRQSHPDSLSVASDFSLFSHPCLIHDGTQFGRCEVTFRRNLLPLPSGSSVHGVTFHKNVSWTLNGLEDLRFHLHRESLPPILKLQRFENSKLSVFLIIFPRFSFPTLFLILPCFIQKPIRKALIQPATLSVPKQCLPWKYTNFLQSVRVSSV